ncbi:YdcF family protein [Bartonella ancashensis]|uniref:YdcF-like protein n=1 Tax=Bartonella ancashensis TaxID=1318743 RepID=A0A0M4LS36_9HYPH|nr:YdcF family protein [Bartonella ancashensis]ALE03172.1 YdcF-like protein [Bartonella ancashensis]
MKYYKLFFRYCSPTILIFSIVLLFICVDFIIFSEKVRYLEPQSPLPEADAIIVLTGGHNRITTGLHLLQKGLGSRLLISGVNTKIDPKRLIDTALIDPLLLACCVDFGHQATNTRGNAEESASWIKQYNYKTVYIVTHDYHMARSLLEFKQLIPQVSFIPYPIKDRETVDFIKQMNQIRIITSEYLKNIYVRIRTLLNLGKPTSTNISDAAIDFQILKDMNFTAIKVIG